MNIQPEKKKKYTLPVLIGVFAALFIVMTVALCIPKEPEFLPPDFDTRAVSGMPDVDDGMGYTELYKEGMSYRVSVCGMPTVSENELILYFTNSEGNEKYLKLRVFDENGNVLGETGLLKPNEYVKSVTLNKTVTADTKLKLKVMGYEPQTYESAGSVSLNVVVNA